MKKITTSILLLSVSCTFGLMNAQVKPKDSMKTTEMKEVIVTGALGIKKKADAVTSTQQVVNAEQLKEGSNPNAVQALAGKVSGLVITQTNSGVVDSNSIVLRGRRSITGNNQALVVIDNVISTASVLQQLPPDLIENVNVIKGAQGAALYGADGVNGVIIVTTKNGTKNNRVNVTLNSTTDFQEVAFVPKRQRNYGQGWDGVKINVENGAWGPAFTDPKFAGLVPYGVPLYDYNNDGIIDVNASDFGATPDNPAMLFSPYKPYGKNNIIDFFKTGSIYNNDVTINGGGDGKYALLSLGSNERNFVVKDDKASRFSVMFKGGAKIKRWTVDGSFNYIRTKLEQTNSNLYHDLLQSSVDVPITAYENYPDNAYAWNVYYKNPYWIIKNQRYNSLSNYFNTSLGVGFEVNKNINIKYTGNLQTTVADNLNYQNDWSNSMVPDAAGIASYLYKNNSYSAYYYGDLIANFDYDLNDNFNLKFNLGTNYQDRTYKITSAGGDNLDIPGLYTIYNIKKPALPSSLSNGRYHRNSYAIFANMDLAFKDFLFLNATARNEWSSVLPKDNNNYFYPSVGLSFVPTKAFRDFGGDFLTYMKIAANYTKVGNSSSIGWYDVNPVAVLGSGFPYSNSGAAQGGLSFVNTTTPTSKNIRPEFVTSKELSVNLGLFRDRITLGGSVYQQLTDDLITFQSTPRPTGLVRNLINVGQMKTEGYEIDLGLTPFRSRDFRWDINASYTHAASKITKVTEDTDEVALTANSMVGIYAEKNELFPLIRANAYQRDSQGRIIIDYATGNPLTTTNLINFGTTMPKHIVSLNTSINIKGVKISATMDYRTGHYFYADAAADMAFNGTLWESGQFDRTKGGFVMPNSVYKDPATGNYVVNTKIKTGGDNYQKLSTYYSSVYNRIGENFIIDATSFKIRELSISYTIPRSVLEGSGIRELTVGVHARNPFMKFAKDNLNYADPETSNTTGNAQGIASNNQYPTLKTYGLNLNVKF